MFSKELRRKIKTSRKIKILIVLVTIILIVLMFPKGESLESDVSINSIWIQEDLIASRTFEILKSPEVYNRERIEAADAVAPIFLKDVQVEQTNLDSMRKYNTYLLQLIDQDNFLNVPTESNFTFLSEPSYETFKNIRRRENILSTPNSLSLSNILKATLSILSSIYNEDVLDVIYEDIDKDSISIRQGKFEELLPKEKFLDMNSVKTRINLLVANTFGNYKELNDAAAEYIFHFIQPTLIYNQSITEETKTISRDKVTKNVGIVNENERIVAKHDRITPEIKLMIDSYRIAKGEERNIGGIIAQNVGKFLHIIIILTLFIIYIYLFRKKIFDDNLKIILILIIILLISFITFLIYQINVKAPVELLILVPVASMLLTIIFDSRVGFYGTIVVALITGGLRGNDYVFAVMNILAGGLAAYTVRDIKNRTQIFRSFLFILIGYIASITAFGLERFDSAENILLHSAFAASNALISPVLTYGLIIFFERIFKITTELTLLELSDFNTTLSRHW
jgi:membrane-associated HD superfamily phosphohydrolase